MPKRPENEKALQEREAIGVIRASRFVRNYARSHKPINIQTICAIHKTIFKNAWPEIAGAYRVENVKIDSSKHLPPHFSQVPAIMQEKDTELAGLLSGLATAEGSIYEESPKAIDNIPRVIHAAAWAHHMITYVHPFIEGNGRTARLAANLILERYGLIGISIRIEKENKGCYRQSLAQIDIAGDYEPLENLIIEGLKQRYNGIAVKYYPLPADSHK